MRAVISSLFILHEKRLKRFAYLLVFTCIFSLALPKLAEADPKLKKLGFIETSDSLMTWADANAYCDSKGGRLPRINKSNSWNGQGTMTIDGFGTVGEPWPKELPFITYWTGTVNNSSPGTACVVLEDPDGKVEVSNFIHDTTNGVACVPY